jgi:hypothetical protein
MKTAHLDANVCTAQFTGILVSKAEARTRQCDSEGHVVPVLCMCIRLENALKTLMHIEQPFPASAYDQAKAAASKHKQGERVTVSVPIDDIVMFTRSALHINVHKPQES